MKTKKLKSILAVALLNTVIVGSMPIAANASWIKESDGSWRWIENGLQSTGWKNVDGKWYYFDSQGKMKTGWVQDNNRWYYLEGSGAMKTGWVLSEGSWYYLSDDGSMKTGWIFDGNCWYYLSANGSMKTGWINYNNSWYFSDASGVMQTGIIKVDGKIYYLDNSGAMQTAVVKIGDIQYTTDTSGALTGENLPEPSKEFSAAGQLINKSETKSSDEIKQEEKSENKQEVKDNDEESKDTGKKASSSGGSRNHHSSNSSSNSSTNSSNNNISDVTEGEDLNITSEGTYGSSEGQKTVKNVYISSPNVVLKNVHITGDLELGEGIGDGDVTLENVTVDGNTIVKGGGENSIHFKDTTLATVIVNKNDGKVRIVVEGKSNVAEVQLESTAKLEESGLEGNSEGFKDVNVSEGVQSLGDLKVELIGSFETINSRAQQVKIQLDESTEINNLVLNVAAAVLGQGKINTATINSSGCSIAVRPNNVVLNADSVSLRDQVVNESYSNAESAELLGITADMSSIAVELDNYIAGLTKNDFNVKAELDGKEIQLNVYKYDSNNRRIYFDPVDLEQNIGKTLKITVSPNSEKLTGNEKTSELTVKHGFSGKITDIHGVGIEGVTIKFTSDNEDSNEITVVTQKDGYYSVEAEPGYYIGEMTGNGIIATEIHAYSLSDRFNTEQNETAIRASVMDGVKIVLSWGEKPHDEDSHLEGPTLDGAGFHTWYADKIYEDENGIRYVDLDWDDTQSYGPETTTIYKLVDGTYMFYVHNFSGESPLVGSGAKVQVYKGSSSTPLKEIKIKNDEGENDRYWYVFNMQVSNNGQDVEINEVNDLRQSIYIKKSDNAESSYMISDDELSIFGVPQGTIGDFKADIVPFDDNELKVFPSNTDIFDAKQFDSTEGLNDSEILKDGQTVAVKLKNGAVKKYIIRLDLDYTELYRAMDSVNELDYTEESWIEYKNAVDDIMNELNNEEYKSQQDIDYAIQRILEAQNLLVLNDFNISGGTTTAAAAAGRKAQRTMSASEENDESKNNSIPLSSNYKDVMLKEESFLAEAGYCLDDDIDGKSKK